MYRLTGYEPLYLLALTDIWKNTGKWGAVMFLFDWLTFTSKVDSLSSIQKLLQLNKADWVAGYGMNGYRDGWYLGSIAIWCNPSRDNMPGICVNMSGQACREFESVSHLDWLELFRQLADSPDDYNITRLDVAYDETEGLLPLDKIAKDVEAGNWVSSFRKYDIHKTSDGLTVSVGSSKSEAMLRMYDKAAERGYTDGRHWVRVELQLRRERAMAFVQQFVYGGFADDLGELWKSVVNDYVRFVTPQDSDSNKRRWPMRRYWAKLMDAAARVKLYKRPGEEYNAFNLHRFVTSQCAGALYTFVRLNSWSVLQKYVERPQKLNPKYERLIAAENYRRQCAPVYQ